MVNSYGLYSERRQADVARPSVEGESGCQCSIGEGSRCPVAPRLSCSLIGASGNKIAMVSLSGAGSRPFGCDVLWQLRAGSMTVALACPCGAVAGRSSFSRDLCDTRCTPTAYARRGSSALGKLCGRFALPTLATEFLSVNDGCSRSVVALCTTVQTLTDDNVFSPRHKFGAAMTTGTGNLARGRLGLHRDLPLVRNRGARPGVLPARSGHRNFTTRGRCSRATGRTDRRPAR